MFAFLLLDEYVPVTTVVISPDDKHIYVGGNTNTEGSILLFDISPINGVLNYKQTFHISESEGIFLSFKIV